MLSHSNRLGVQVFQRIVLTATTARGCFPSPVKKAGAILRERAILFVKDLDLFTSFSIARFILWRRTRREH